MTGVEIIIAALAAGGTAGLSAAGQDAYTSLRGALARRLRGRGHAEQALEADETDPGVWQARIGVDLAATGADRDAAVLAAAHRLLSLVDLAGSQVGKYIVDVSGSSGVQVGDGAVHVDTNHGAVGSFHAPVTFTAAPNPPAGPAAT